MLKHRNTSWWKSFLFATFVAVVLLSLLIGWFRTEELTTKWIVAVFFSVCLGLFAYRAIHDWLQDRRLRQLLHGREAFVSETFGTHFFSNLTRGPEVAATVRRLLEEHLERELVLRQRLILG